MEQAAGIVLLLLAVALVIQLMRAGPAGVREWLRAKFLGQTAAGQRAAARASPTASSSSGGGGTLSSIGHGITSAFGGPFNPATYFGG